MDVQRQKPPIPPQSVPETGSDERMHVLDGTCWCQPEVAEVPPTIRHRDES